eukprot:1635911-Prymnesium_polylepis.1
MRHARRRQCQRAPRRRSTARLRYRGPPPPPRRSSPPRGSLRPPPFASRRSQCRPAVRPWPAAHVSPRWAARAWAAIRSSHRSGRE